jgi:hypothetical protein
MSFRAVNACCWRPESALADQKSSATDPQLKP